MVSKLRGASLLFLLVAACATEVFASTERELLAASSSFSQSSSASSNSQGGSASAGNRISVSRGTGRSVSRATSEAFSKAKSDIQEIVNGAVNKIPKKGKSNKSQFCRNAALSVEEEANAIATVAVEASVSTFSFVSIDGIGSGCANAEADAEASATTLAKAVVEAWAIARNVKDIVSAEASLRAVIRALATASANAAASACITADGSRSAPSFAEAFQDVIAEAYTRAAASILVWLEAFVDCAGEGDSFVEAEADASLHNDDARVEGNTSTRVEGEGNALTDAGGSASVNQTTKCSDVKSVNKCCRGKNKKKNTKKCYCTISGRKSNRLPNCEAEKVITDGITFWQYKVDGKEGACEC